MRRNTSVNRSAPLLINCVRVIPGLVHLLLTYRVTHQNDSCNDNR